jgi:hypothetical protein
MDTGVNTPVFRPMEVKVTSSFPAPDILEQNIKANLVANWPRFHERSDYGKMKGRPVAICAGGPSLKQFLGKVYDDFSDVMVCGSAHDFVVASGIDPTYSVQLDGHPMCADFFRMHVPDIQYLMASQCDPIMFDGLNRSQVSMWHALMGEEPELRVFNDEPAIGGGCTTTLRAINLAIMLGYHDLHLFGFDSCFDDVTAQHAYEYEEWGSNLTQFLVNVDDGKPFKCNGLFLAQAQQFQEMCKNFGHMFEPHVYGDGLIAEMIKVGLKKTGELK